MKSLIRRDAATVERLRVRLEAAKGSVEEQRIRCVLLRVAFSKSATEIAAELGWSVGSVYVIHSRWAREEDAIFDVSPRGGRRHQFMTWSEEVDFLDQFLSLDKAAAVPVTIIHQAYQQRVQKEVSKSTIYRLLNRHRRPEPKGSDPSRVASFLFN